MTPSNKNASVTPIHPMHTVRASNAISGVWHRTSRGWSRSFSEHGQRVAVFQVKPDGTFFARVGPSDRQRQISLQTTNRDVAEACARDYLAGPTVPLDPPTTDEVFRWRIVPLPLPASAPATLTLHHLMCLYVASNRVQSKNKPTTQQKNMSALQILLMGMGPITDVSMLDGDTLDGYVLLRRRGGIAYHDFVQLPDGAVRPYARVTGPVKSRSVLLELVLLQAMVRWATETRPENKQGYVLAEWPMRDDMLRGLKKAAARERVGRAPLPRDTIQRLLATALSLAAQARAAEDLVAAVRWTRLALALLIVDVTGERIGGVRQLRRSDLKFVQRGLDRELRLTYRGETLKPAQQRTIPFPPPESRLAQELLLELPIIGEGLLFPNAKRLPMTTDGFIDELHDLAHAAEVHLTPNSAWHGARVTWATERRHLDHKAVMKAGGWSDYKTFEAYVRLTEDDVRDAVASPRTALTLPALDGSTPTTPAGHLSGVRRRPGGRRA